MIRIIKKIKTVLNTKMIRFSHFLLYICFLELTIRSISNFETVYFKCLRI
jgi:hypothetical protein